MRLTARSHTDVNPKRIILRAFEGVCMPTFSLFEAVCSEKSGEAYRQMEVREIATPYIDYLKRVQKWHKDRSVSWKVRRPDEEASGGAGRASPRGQSGRKRRQRGVPVSLAGVGRAEFRRIVDAARALGHVYDYDPAAGPRLSKEDMIEVVGIDEGRRRIWLERDPAKPYLKAERNTYQTAMMARAMEEILHRPRPGHMPLRRLFRKKSGAAWPRVKAPKVDGWFFLRDDGIDGAGEQRKFVRIALGTPDFAFLEGPPGSGKTTVLCELVAQMAARGRRVLFCASTHVAVDNLLERIVDGGGDVARLVAPIRIGESEKVSDMAARYEYGRFARTIVERMRSDISGLKARSRAQEMMLEALEGGGAEALGRMVRDHANLVCGTTMGMLAHPDIKSRTLRRFDMMIIDEASKTTLQEFLVPAVHADRWVIVGDTRQLVPYTDQDDMAVHVGACIEPVLGNACLDAFMAKRRGQTTVLDHPGKDAESAYREQCKKIGVSMRREGRGGGSGGGGVGGKGEGEILVSDGGSAAVQAARPRGAVLRGAAGDAAGRGAGGDRTWAGEVAWRIGIHWHGMNGAGGERGKKLAGEIDMLMPARDEGGEVRQWIDRVKRIAVPSVLEVIQDGFPVGHDGGGTLLENGMPGGDFGSRHVLLEWQHRMHPGVAAFSHRHMYGGQALRTPGGMAGKRAWGYERYGARAVWIDVRGSGGRGGGESASNEAEAASMAGEIRAFAEFAGRNGRPDGKPWDVAVLPLYVGQMRLLQKHLSGLDPRGGPHTFRIPHDGPSVVASLRTVDSFQGHEADLVLLGLTNSHATLFLANPNRLNVALTRARYQCIVFGDKKAMSKDPLLGALVSEMSSYRPIHKSHPAQGRTAGAPTPAPRAGRPAAGAAPPAAADTGASTPVSRAGRATSRMLRNIRSRWGRARSRKGDS